MKIRYTPQALPQLDEIFSYIETENPAAAPKVKARLKQSIERLGRFPYSCRVTETPDIRVLAVVRLRYLVFYAVDEGTQEVQILRVRHSSQDPSHHLD